MYVLKNDRVTVEIAGKGAEMRRLTLDGRDLLWSGDPAVWAGVAPLLFPLCGGTEKDAYTYRGREYPMEKHGFIRFKTFAAETVGEREITLLQTSSPETLAQYPFAYALRVAYRLEDTALHITYTVDNTGSGEMLFSIGSHEGYACPEGIEAYDVVFEQEETLATHPLIGNLLSRQTVPVLNGSRVLPLREQYFETDALVFKHLRSRAATLRHRDTGSAVTVEFPGCAYFLLWHKPGAPYICMEPWSGIPGFVDEPPALETKEGIIRLPAGERFVRTHTIRIG